MHLIADISPCENQSMNCNSIFVIVDRYIKMIQYIPAPIDWILKELAEALIQNILREKDLPDSSVSDWGSF